VAGAVVTVERPPRPRAMDTLGPMAILRGLIVTASHFFRNLMGFVRGKPTIFTVQYPEELQKVSPAFRGMPVLVQMPNGKERCVACGLCEWACPVDCITIYPAETEDEIERYPAVFDIDMSIVMSQRVAIATTEWRGSVWHKRDLLTPAAELQTRLTHIRRGYERTGASTIPATRGRA
jgi:ferredoxin